MGNDLLNQRYKLITGYPAGDDITEEIFDLEAKAKHFDNIDDILNYRHPKRKKYGTQKKGTPCPNCGGGRFDFHSGRWKSCASCGFSNFLENLIREVKWLAKRNRLSEVSTEKIGRLVEYIEGLNN